MHRRELPMAGMTPERVQDMAPCGWADTDSGPSIKDRLKRAQTCSTVTEVRSTAEAAAAARALAGLLPWSTAPAADATIPTDCTRPLGESSLDRLCHSTAAHAAVTANARHPSVDEIDLHAESDGYQLYSAQRVSSMAEHSRLHLRCTPVKQRFAARLRVSVVPRRAANGCAVRGVPGTYVGRGLLANTVEMFTSTEITEACSPGVSQASGQVCTYRTGLRLPDELPDKLQNEMHASSNSPFGLAIQCWPA